MEGLIDHLAPIPQVKKKLEKIDLLKFLLEKSFENPKSCDFSLEGDLQQSEPQTSLEGGSQQSKSTSMEIVENMAKYSKRDSRKILARTKRNFLNFQPNLFTDKEMELWLSEIKKPWKNRSIAWHRLYHRLYRVPKHFSR